jgi:tetratricopeptide (TPR) repeat protein
MAPAARLLAAMMLAGLASNAEPPARAAGGKGPELRSRVTRALDELQRAVAAEPAAGSRWWSLGIHAQVAAGGSVPEEQAAVALLERALELSPGLAVPYENAMAIGDMHRGVRNATRARHFYAFASDANPLAPVQYMYAGLTYELEGNFALAGRAYMLASRAQAHHMRVVCEKMADTAPFAAACWPTGKGSSTTYVAYLAAAVLKAGDLREAQKAYAQVLGFPGRQSLASDCATQLIANAATGRIISLLVNYPHPLRTAERQYVADAASTLKSPFTQCLYLVLY